MIAWNQGKAIVDELIADGAIQRLVGADAGVGDLMDRARTMLRSAAALLASDPVTAYTVAYDAAKHAGMALLAEQNLRATGGHAHLTIEKVLTAQFGGTFDRFSRLRRRRNELDYPQPGQGFADQPEATRAHGAAGEIVDNAQKILDQKVLASY